MSIFFKKNTAVLEFTWGDIAFECYSHTEYSKACEINYTTHSLNKDEETINLILDDMY